MRTTLNISDALLRELRKQAADTSRPFREVVEETIALGLAQRSRPRRRRRFTVRPHALGVKPGFRNLSSNQLYDQIEAEASLKKP